MSIPVVSEGLSSVPMGIEIYTGGKFIRVEDVFAHSGVGKLPRLVLATKSDEGPLKPRHDALGGCELGPEDDST